MDKKTENINILPPNLELESHKIVVPSANAVVRVDSKTKIEHKKIIGLFLMLNGGTNANYNSKLSVSVDTKAIVSPQQFHAFIIEKTAALSIVEAMWHVDIEIQSSDIHIQYNDSGEIGSGYEATLYLVCEKK